MLNRLSIIFILLAGLNGSVILSMAAETKQPPVIDTQDPSDIAPTPDNALAKITVPQGFSATLFAGDPHVRQPIAFCHDDRGRLWVVENYSYPEWKVKNSDRILIFEDTDNDGRFDKRKIFFDSGNQLTGIEIGLGGVWCTASPYLIFIPDADRNDVPDTEPQILLDGFNLHEVGHNVVNGLRWGPDGWLYGRHGIKATSRVGRPGTTDEDRTLLNCSIWRYHPLRHQFEVVTRGTTNPWGFDYNDVGEMFFTNNVNGHLWHAVPGANFERMHGISFNPHVYQTMQMCADHFHWSGTNWADTRKRKGEPNQHDQFGGGHSHCGGMIYLGDNWPEKYRGHVFTCNTHGKRINQTLLERNGAGYVGRRGSDFMRANSDWFRGVELKYGPDGGVFVTDWTDLGECHDRDGIHRSSGRIYKIVYGQAPPLKKFDLHDCSNQELVQLQLHRNDWYVRRARRILWERTLDGQNMDSARAALLKMYTTNPDVTRKLRAMWALNSIGGFNQKWLVQQLDHPSEHIRVWAIRLLGDFEVIDINVVSRFAKMAQHDPSSLVRLYLASAMQRIPAQQRWPIAEALADHAQDRNDKDLPLMIWYGIEPAVAKDMDRAIRLISHTKMPIHRQFLARRITAEVDRSPQALESLIALLIRGESEAMQLDLLQGINDALHGRRKVAAPPSWPIAQKKFAGSPDPKLRELATSIAVIFGDGLALGKLRETMLDQSAAPNARRRAIETLSEIRSDGLAPALQKLVNDRFVCLAAIRGLAVFDDPKTPSVLMKGYDHFDKPDKQASIDVLVSRASYAGALLDALEQQRVPATDISVLQARQIHALKDSSLTARLDEVWGTLQSTSAEKQAKLARYKKLLNKKYLATADLSSGRLIFKKSCSQCHKLFDDGEDIAPNLTGSGRANLDYVLQNIIDPSAVVAADYRMFIFVLNDGRVISGTIHSRSEKTVVIQTEKDRLAIELSLIEESRRTTQSLMPDGLLKELSDQQVRDLTAYLASPVQIELPTDSGDSR